MKDTIIKRVPSLLISSLVLFAVTNGLPASSSPRRFSIGSQFDRDQRHPQINDRPRCDCPRQHYRHHRFQFEILRGGDINYSSESVRRGRIDWLRAFPSNYEADCANFPPLQDCDAAYGNSSRSDPSQILNQHVPHFYPKEDKEMLFIQNVLRENFLFQDFAQKYDNIKKESSSRTLSPDKVCKKQRQHQYNPAAEEIPTLSGVIGSFEKIKYSRGKILTEQGDAVDTDYLYLIGNGTCSVTIDGKLLPEPYGTLGKGAMIGELALLYGSARAATIRCMSPVTLYRLHRSDFYHFLDDRISSNGRTGEDQDGDEDNDSFQTPVVADALSSSEIQKQVKEIDDIIDKISGVKSRYHGQIIRQFRPQRSWLWRRWTGTILQHAWKPAFLNMVLSVVFICVVRLSNHRFYPNHPVTWPIGALPDQSHPLIIRMSGMYKLWGYTMSITTFVLTFFLSQAYALWTNIYTKGRQIQGRFNDISLVLACAVERCNKSGDYTARGRSLLNEIAASIRLCHAFSWAGFVKRFNVLLTSRGLSRMLSRGIMTPSQYLTLVGIGRNSCGPQHVTLMWILSQIFQGMRDGIIPSDNATRSCLINKVCDLRSVFGGVGDSLDGRIPIAYAHFVQLIVDIFLALAPFALYCELGIWSIPAVGILNIFYSGMLDLAKILLDPMDNDSEFYKDSAVNMDIGVLIREGNDGSNRWKTGLEKLPFKYR